MSKKDKEKKVKEKDTSKNKTKKERTEQEKSLLREKIAIAVLVSVFILVIIIGLTIAYFRYFHYKTILVQTMNSNREYYDTYGNSFILDKDPINNEYFKPLKYTFVDFNEDGRDELVTFIANDTGIIYYLILKYNYEQEKVYGYLINSNDFQALRKDGTVATTGKDGYHRYYDILFEGNDMYFKDLAIHRASDNYYSVYGEACYKDMFDEFVEEWMKREIAEWEIDLIDWGK